MLVQLFGILDLLAALFIVLSGFELLSVIGFYIGIFVILKGIIFFSGIVSLMDIFGGVMLVLGVSQFYYFLVWIFFFWYLQKAVFSFLH